MDSCLHNNAIKLKSKLHKIRYENNLSIEELASGNTVIFLQLVHYILIDYSPEIASMILEKGYDLY